MQIVPTLDEQYHVNSVVSRVTVPSARSSSVARVSRSGKKTQCLIIMLVERDCHEIRWLY
jgi:hypothetical protein